MSIFKTFVGIINVRMAGIEQADKNRIFIYILFSITNNFNNVTLFSLRHCIYLFLQRNLLSILIITPILNNNSFILSFETIETYTSRRHISLRLEELLNLPFVQM